MPVARAPHPPAVQETAPRTAPRQKPRSERERLTLHFSPAEWAAIGNMATEKGIPRSQAARLVLADQSSTSAGAEARAKELLTQFAEWKDAAIRIRAAYDELLRRHRAATRAPSS